MKRIEVEVTARDISQGCAYNDHLCPVALAVARKTRTFVTAGYIGIRAGTRFAKTPKRAAERMQSFDMYGLMRPFTFTLELTE